MFSLGLRHICLSSPYGHSQAPLSGKAQPGRHMQSFAVTKLTGILKLIQSGDIAVKQKLVEKPLAECWLSILFNTDAWLTTHWKKCCFFTSSYLCEALQCQEKLQSCKGVLQLFLSPTQLRLERITASTQVRERSSFLIWVTITEHRKIDHSSRQTWYSYILLIFLV